MAATSKLAFLLQEVQARENSKLNANKNNNSNCQMQNYLYLSRYKLAWLLVVRCMPANWHICYFEIHNSSQTVLQSISSFKFVWFATPFVQGIRANLKLRVDLKISWWGIAIASPSHVLLWEVSSTENRGFMGTLRPPWQRPWSNFWPFFW